MDNIELEIIKTLIEYGILGIIAYFYMHDTNKLRKAEIENNRKMLEFLTNNLTKDMIDIRTCITTLINISNKNNEQLNTKLLEIKKITEHINDDEEQLLKIKDILSSALKDK